VGSFKSPYFLGDLQLPSNIFCSPLAGCSDLPFRQMTHSYSPGLIFCEMVKMDALVRHDPNTYRILDYERGMHPIGAQLCGSKPELAAPCARIIEDLGFDVIDLNCGCPVDKVTRDGSGSGLMRNPDKIGEILSNMVNAVSIPVTVKVRTGWSEEEINAPLITQIAEEAGAVAIFVHGRTRAQGYRGPAKWEHIRACVEAAKTIDVFGNGDIVDAASGASMFETTGCAGILLSRGTFGQAWLIEDLMRHFEGLEPIKRTSMDLPDAFCDHFRRVTAYQSPRRALLDLRRISAWYLRQGHGLKELRGQLTGVASVEKAFEFIESYSWESVVL